MSLFPNKKKREEHPVHGTEVGVIESIIRNPSPMVNEKPHPHYFKPCPYTHIDVYRVLDLFEVQHPALQHAVKKLLVAGGRGAKNVQKDVEEVIASCNRFLEMRHEEVNLGSKDVR